MPAQLSEQNKLNFRKLLPSPLFWVPESGSPVRLIIEGLFYLSIFLIHPWGCQKRAVFLLNLKLPEFLVLQSYNSCA